jgi:hypothetical protein
MKSISIVTAAFNECPGIIQLANEWLTFFDQHPDISAGEVIICDDHSDLHQYESLRDSFIDLLNYCAIAMLVLDDKWPKG